MMKTFGDAMSGIGGDRNAQLGRLGNHVGDPGDKRSATRQYDANIEDVLAQLRGRLREHIMNHAHDLFEMAVYDSVEFRQWDF